MSNKFIALVACMVLAGNMLFAQNPGYMGNHFLLSFNAYAFPAWQNWTRGHVQTLERPLLNFRQSINAEYVISKRVAIGVSYLQFASVSGHHNIDSASLSLPQLNYRAQGGELYAKIFHSKESGCIAPVGFYDKIGISLIHLSGNGDLKSADGKSSRAMATKTIMAPALNYGYGVQTIVARRLVINCGIDFSLLLTGNEFKMHDENNDAAHFNNNVVKFMSRQAAGQMLFNLNAGIGLLLF